MLTSPVIKTMVPTPKNDRNHFIEIGLLAIIIVLFSWFVLKPRFIAFSVNKKELNKLQEDQKMIAQNKEKLLALIKDLDGQPQASATLDEALPLESRITTVAVLADSLAKANGLQVATMSLDGAETSKTVVAGQKEVLADPFEAQRKLNSATILMTTSGTLEQFVGFLNALENSTRIVDVQTIDISPQETEELLFKVKIKGYTFSNVAK